MKQGEDPERKSAARPEAVLSPTRRSGYSAVEVTIFVCVGAVVSGQSVVNIIAGESVRLFERILQYGAAQIKPARGARRGAMFELGVDRLAARLADT